MLNFLARQISSFYCQFVVCEWRRAQDLQLKLIRISQTHNGLQSQLWEREGRGVSLEGDRARVQQHLLFLQWGCDFCQSLCLCVHITMNLLHLLKLKKQIWWAQFIMYLIRVTKAVLHYIEGVSSSFICHHLVLCSRSLRFWVWTQ